MFCEHKVNLHKQITVIPPHTGFW